MAQRHEEETTEFKVETLILCINNCGFSGNPSTKNMCQNCYKASTNVGIIPPLTFSGSQETTTTTTTTTKPRSTSSVVRLQTERSENRRDLTMSTTTAAMMMMTKTEEEKKERSENRRDLTISTTTAMMMMTKTEKEGSSSSSSTEKRRAPEVNRCSGCRRKVGLTGFRCRCGDLFCSEHRYSDRHVCSYDYKAAGRDAIARENPVVKAAKIVRV